MLDPQDPGVRALARAILAADPSISEGVKWNAPSFRTTEWFATINLRAKRGIAVILHFGAKKTAHAETGVEVDDPEHLLEWLGKDRAQVTFRDEAHLAASLPAFTLLLRNWLKNGVGCGRPHL